MKTLLTILILLLLGINSQAQLRQVGRFDVPFDMYHPDKNIQYTSKVTHSIIALSAVMILATYANHTKNKDLHQVSKGLFLGISIAAPIYIFKNKKCKRRYH